MKAWLLFLLVLLATSQSKKFQFNEDGEFTIMQMTDLHFGESEEADRQSMIVQQKLLETVKPDLVIITGDAVSGHYWEPMGAKKGFFEENWKKWTQVFSDMKTHYAYLLGNHDDEADLNRREIMQLDMTHPFSASNISLEGMSGASTYTIPVHSSLSEGKVSANLWILDSGGMGCDGIKDGYGCIERDQIAWYNEESRRFKEEHGTHPHHLAFFHIPLPEYLDIYNTKTFYGRKEDLSGCPNVNTGFFSAVLANGDISAMFVGHDHANDYGGVLEGIELVYGRKTGYGNYGPGLGIQKGARIIKLKEVIKDDGTVEVNRTHFIANEDGTYDTTKLMRKRSDSRQSTCISPSSYIYQYLKPQPAESTFPEENPDRAGRVNLALLFALIGLFSTLGLYFNKKNATNVDVCTYTL